MAVPENNFCDNCKTRVAIYVEKKRRRGKLTRDQYCASCLGHICRATSRKRSEFTRINYDN